MPPYTPPLTQFLTYGDCRKLRDWPDYVKLGFGPEHAPELIRMALDEDLHQADSDGLDVWAPIHAWRTLGQLRAEAASEPLLALLQRIDDDGDDWVGEELPRVYGLIGLAAVPVLARYLADPQHGLWARVAACHGLSEIGQQHPDSRAECAALITRQLEHYGEQDSTLNAFLFSRLLDLRAVESALVIERAFAADAIDPTVAGDWEDAQVALGLKAKRSTPRPDYLSKQLGFDRHEFLNLLKRAAAQKPAPGGDPRLLNWQPAQTAPATSKKRRRRKKP